MAADDQVADHDDDLVVGEPLAVRLGLEQCADQVVASLVGAGIDHPLDVDHQTLHRGVGPFDLFGIHEPEHGTQGIRVLDEVRDVVVGHPEERQITRIGTCDERVDEVTAATSDDVGERGGGQLGRERPVSIDRSGREHPSGKPTEAVVRLTFVGEHQATSTRCAVHRPAHP